MSGAFGMSPQTCRSALCRGVSVRSSRSSWGVFGSTDLAGHGTVGLGGIPTSIPTSL